MIEIKEATKKAIDFGQMLLLDSYQVVDDPRVEEVEEIGAQESWRVIVSFGVKEKQAPIIPSPFPIRTRIYKEFLVDSNGKVKSMKVATV